MNLKLYSIIFLLCTFSFQLKAQLFIDNSYSIEEMVMDFFNNSCVTPSNISTTGTAESVAFFDAGATDLGIPAGIFISTGNVFSAIGPNSAGSTGQNMNIEGDADLNNLLGSVTYDGCTIEMDIVATESILKFSYVFASEEYPEFVGSSFNDIFAFFISGPGINGIENIALIPGTTQAVSINNINANANADFYVNNIDGQYIEFDGFTTELVAEAQVVPNETYQVKIVIGDAVDGSFDSGIFLGIESLCGNNNLELNNSSDVTINGNTATFENNTKYASSYYWDFGDETSSTEKIPAPHTYTTDGIYEVSLITSNFCCSDTTITEVQIGDVTSATNLEEKAYSIAPNPIKDFTQVSLKNGEEFQLRIFNSIGKLLHFENGIGQSYLSLAELPSGLYFMEIQIGETSYSEKIIKN